MQWYQWQMLVLLLQRSMAAGFGMQQHDARFVQLVYQDLEHVLAVQLLVHRDCVMHGQYHNHPQQDRLLQRLYPTYQAVHHLVLVLEVVVGGMQALAELVAHVFPVYQQLEHLLLGYMRKNQPAREALVLISAI